MKTSGKFECSIKDISIKKYKNSELPDDVHTSSCKYSFPCVIHKKDEGYIITAGVMYEMLIDEKVIFEIETEVIFNTNSIDLEHMPVVANKLMDYTDALYSYETKKNIGGVFPMKLAPIEYILSEFEKALEVFKNS